MLIAQAPLRVSLFGGGSDLPAFLARHDGAVLSFAINRRVFIIGHPFTHREGILFKYSQTEDVQKAGDLQHPIANEVFSLYGLNDIDIAVMSDVPAGTGLGSSSSFTVACLTFASRLNKLELSAEQLASEACRIEIEVLKEPIGYQDQWAAALGGVNTIEFSGTSVVHHAVDMNQQNKLSLERNIFLVPVGKPRSASSLLELQSQQITPDSVAEKATRRLVDLVSLGETALMSALDDLGPLLHEAWCVKREIVSGVTNEAIDNLYARGLLVGATGGKLLGAGGSGYLAFYVPEDRQEEFSGSILDRLNFSISDEGAGVIHES